MDTKTLEAVKNEVLSAGAAVGGSGGGAAPAPSPDDAARAARLDAEGRGWAQIPKAFGGALAMAMPELAEVYSDEACLAWGRSMAEVAELYGWSAGNAGPWLGLAACTVQFALPTVAAIRARKAIAQAAAPRPAADAGAGAGDGATGEGVEPRKVAPVG